jgi:hypothetical protein
MYSSCAAGLTWYNPANTFADFVDFQMVKGNIARPTGQAADMPFTAEETIVCINILSEYIPAFANPADNVAISASSAAVVLQLIEANVVIAEVAGYQSFFTLGRHMGV